MRRIHGGKRHRPWRRGEKEVVGQPRRTQRDRMAGMTRRRHGGRDGVARARGCCLSVKFDVRASAFSLDAFG